MAQETPNYPAFREADASAKLSASAKRIEKADRSNVNKRKNSAKPVRTEPVQKEFSRETSDTGDGRLDSPLSANGNNGDGYFKKGPVKYVEQTPNSSVSGNVEYNNAHFNFTMDNLRSDLDVLGPLVEHFKQKYLYAMAVVIRTEDPNYDQSKTIEDPKLEKAAELVESMGRKEGEVRNSSKFAKELFEKIDESLKQELIKLGIVGEGEGNVDKLFERTSKYVEKAREIIDLDDKNKELQKSDSDDEMAKMERRLNRKDVSPTLTSELESAQAVLAKLEENIAFMGNGDPKLLTQARFMVKDRLDKARENIERIQTEIKNEKKEYVEKKAPEPGRENENEEVTLNNKKIKRLQERLIEDSTQYDKYHVKNPGASWDSENKKVKVEESLSTEPQVDAKVTASLEVGAKTTLNEPIMGAAIPAVESAGDTEVNVAWAQLEIMFKESKFVGKEVVKFSDETIKVENIFAELDTVVSALDRENQALRSLDQEIAQKRNELNNPLELLEPVEGDTEVSLEAVPLFNSAAASEPVSDSEEIKVLLKRRESLVRPIALNEAKRKEILTRNNIPEDKQSEFLELGKQLALATELTLRANGKIEFVNAELSKPDSELAKKLGLEGKDELKAKLLARLQKEKETAFSSVNDTTEKMNLIMGVTNTKSTPGNAESGTLGVGGNGSVETTPIIGTSPIAPAASAQVADPNGTGSEAANVIVPEKGRLARYWDSVKSFIDKTVGKDAPKVQRVSIYVAVGLIAAILFGTRGFGAVKLGEDLVKRGPDQADKAPIPTPTKTGPLVSPLPTPTPIPEVVKDGDATRVVPVIPAVVDFTKLITDVIGAPDVFVDRANPSWSSATPTPASASVVTPSNTASAVVEAPQVSVVRLVPVELKEGDSLSAKYHENGYFTEVTDWSHENAMPMVIQMLTDNIKNPEFWNRLFENSPELKNDSAFKGAVRRAQSANYSQADEKAIKDLLSQHFKFSNLTAKEIADGLGLNKTLAGTIWNIPAKVK